MERTEMRMIRAEVDVWCISEGKTAQFTEPARGKWGCDEKMQTEVASTCGKKGRWRTQQRLKHRLKTKKKKVRVANC